MRVCIVYDCLFPYTIGGAERWYRDLSERLVAAGHEVTYLTRRQWPDGEAPDISGVDVIAVTPRTALYTSSGRRRILPPLAFGAGVFWRLLRNGRDYDVVHTASFPYFSLLAAGALLRWAKYRLVVDWFEFWSRDYWSSYLGKTGGRMGWAVQKLCLKVPQQAFCLARLTAERLRSERLKGGVVALEGAYSGSLQRREPSRAFPTVVFAGRHIPEKRATAVAPAIHHARRAMPELEGCIFGSGPEHSAVLAQITELGLEGVVSAPGFAPAEALKARMAEALCLVLPSLREGYGLVVVEAIAMGTPVVLVQGEDNAAVELIESGVNGFVAKSASPSDLGGAILKVQAAGHALRISTADWYAQNAQRLSLDSSMQRVMASYAKP